jgi:hypothetical protein
MITCPTLLCSIADFSFCSLTEKKQLEFLLQAKQTLIHSICHAKFQYDKSPIEEEI